MHIKNILIHLNIGKHDYFLEKESFIDKAKLKYAELLESGDSCVEGVVMSSNT